MDRVGVAGPWFHRGLHGGRCPGALAELEACQRELELRPRRTTPRQHLATSSRPRYQSGEGALRQSCLPCHGPPAAAAT
jgi:hypothetical protein